MIANVRQPSKIRCDIDVACKGINFYIKIDARDEENPVIHIWKGGVSEDRISITPQAANAITIK